jgi:hypothetical protein
MSWEISFCIYHALEHGCFYFGQIFVRKALIIKHLIYRIRIIKGSDEKEE